MIYNVAGLLTDSEGSIRHFEFNGEQLFTDRHHFTGVSGRVEMLRTDRTILVTSTVQARAEDTCGRCLELATVDLSVEFEEEFEPANSDLMGERPSPVHADLDPALVIDERNVLDLSESLAQALSLAMPISPLCKAECKGLCPTCFINRNTTECRCDQNPTDPRWQLLAQLTQESSHSSS
jgi:uncharacterized protein